jgi:hypothetical protein
MKLILKAIVISLIIFSGCKKTDENDVTQQVGGNTVQPPNTRLLRFIFTPPLGGNISGEGRVYYTQYNANTYVFGNVNDPNSWTGTNTSQQTSFTVTVPPGVPVHYSFTSDPAAVYTVPDLSVEYVPVSGANQIVLSPTHSLTGYFVSPQ